MIIPDNNACVWEVKDKLKAQMMNPRGEILKVLKQQNSRPPNEAQNSVFYSLVPQNFRNRIEEGREIVFRIKT